MADTPTPPPNAAHVTEIMDWDFVGAENAIGDLTFGLQLPKTQITLVSTPRGRNAFADWFADQQRRREWK